MGIDFVFRVAAIGIVAAVLYQVLKHSGREDYAMMTAISGLIVVFLMIVKEISTMFNTIKTIFGL